MRNESEQSGALFRSKGRIWTLPVRLPGNSSRVCVRCIAKSGCVMGNTAFINLNRFSAVLTSRPRWIEVNWEDTKCQSNLWENNSLAGQWCQQCDLWALQPAQGVPPVNHTSEMYSWWVTGWNKVILSFFLSAGRLCCSLNRHWDWLVDRGCDLSQDLKVQRNGKGTRKYFKDRDSWETED